RAVRDVMPQQFLPLALQRARYRGIAVTGEIGDSRAISQSEEIDLPRAPRRSARVREPCLSRQCVDGARLAGVRTPGEGNFARTRRRQLGDRRSSVLEFCAHERTCSARWRAFGRVGRLRYNGALFHADAAAANAD